MAKLCGQFTPLRACPDDPENGFHKQTWVAPGLAGVSLLAKAVRFDGSPLNIGQNASGQSRSPGVCNFESELKPNVNPERQQALVERCFNKLKNARRVATRYDKTAESFLGFIDITSIRLWFRLLST